MFSCDNVMLLSSHMFSRNIVIINYHRIGLGDYLCLDIKMWLQTSRIKKLLVTIKTCMVRWKTFIFIFLFEKSCAYGFCLDICILSVCFHFCNCSNYKNNKIYETKWILWFIFFLPSLVYWIVIGNRHCWYRQSIKFTNTKYSKIL